MLKKLYYWFHKKISKPEERGEYSSGYWSDMVRAKVLELCEGSQGSLLEVGCGEGLFLTKLAEKSQTLNIYGADIWGKMLQKAKKKLKANDITNVRLFHADTAFLPFEDGSFDIVVCINTFYNLPSKELLYASLKEMFRVCKGGKRIIFDIRNSLNFLLYLKYKLAKYYDETIKSQNIPLRTYRLKNVIPYLRQNNFKIIQRIPIGFPQNSFAPIIIVEARKIK